MQAGVEDRLITAELVDHVPGDQRLVGGIEDRGGAEEVRERSAAVDIGDEDHRKACRSRQAHVGDVGGAEVDLGDRSCAFADDDVEFCTQRGEFVGDHLAQLRTSGEVVPRTHIAGRSAADHDVRTSVTARFQQHRVESCRRCESARCGL
ncbi:Uncharacterised protein [Mycobacteroides abscessus subsp. abscessus]|nr:Uncharacterised protein [Mycobacteroides abscessus subsp. abscessus]